MSTRVAAPPPAPFDAPPGSPLTDSAAMLGVFRDSGFMIRSKLAGTTVDVGLSLTPSARSVAACEAREHTATIASVRPLLRPKAVAVIGVSRKPAFRLLARRLLSRGSGAQGIPQ